MATTPPSSPARRDEPAQLTITSKIELKLLPSSATARKLAFNDDGVLLGADLYDKCLNLTQPRLPGGQRSRLKLTEHDAPFVLRSGGESLLKTLDVSILHDRWSGVEGDRFTIGDQPLKVTAHKIANDTALLVDPKKNGTLFRHTEAHDLERVVPCDGTDLSTIGLLPGAELSVEFGEFQTIAELGGVLVANSEGKACFLNMKPDDTIADLQRRCALPQNCDIPVEHQKIVVGPRREVVTDLAMRLDSEPLETARRLDAVASGGAYWCVDTRDAQCAEAIQGFKPLGTYANTSFAIYVATLTGKRLRIPQVHLYDTVQDLKARIQNSEGIPPDQQRLICSGKQMTDEAMLFDYNLKADQELHLVLRLRGGMFHETSGRLDLAQLAALTAEVHVYNDAGALLLKTSMPGGVSIDAAKRLVEEADEVDMEVDALDLFEARNLAKQLLREKRKREDDVEGDDTP